MTKVPPKGVGARPPRLPQAQRVDRSRRPKASEKAEKAKPTRARSAETVAPPDESESPQAAMASEVAQSREEIGRELEKRSEWLHTDVHEDDREQKATHDEAHKSEERTEKKEPGFRLKAAPGKTVSQKGGAPAKKPSDGFEQGGVGKKALTMALDKAEGVSAAQSLTKAVEAAATRPGKPLDAMALLHAAKEAGVFFEEDGGAQGGGQEEPELAAAVQEARRLLFGVRGIHRVGPGKNDAGEPVVVVVAHRGFGESALIGVPPKVHRFATLLALPYELLPLRRER